jgi:epidermal growth factor receptor substrate 15
MAASFSPSPAELALTQQIFAHADPKKLGALTGDVAVRVFGGANLAPTVLGEIWQIADETNNGWLSQKGVAMAVRLMGHAQKGEKVSAALLSKREQAFSQGVIFVLIAPAGPLPTITGITPVVAQGTGASSASRAKSPQPGLPPFTPQDKAKFQNMFLKSGPVDGLLSGVLG